MSRHPKPWPRKGRPGFYAWINGQQVKLTDENDREAAYKELYRLLLKEGLVETSGDLTIAEACDLYLEHVAKVNKPSSVEVTRYRLQSAINAFGRVSVGKLKKSQVEVWLAGYQGSSATKRGMLVALRSAFNWCREEELLRQPDCLKKVKTPRMVRRERTLAPEERQRLLDKATPELGDLLVALTETGARPHIVCELEARHVDWLARTATIESKGKYVIILTDRMLELLRRLALKQPTGPLLRDEKGRPWTNRTRSKRFKWLRKHTGCQGVVPYTYRHSLATDALENGMSPAFVATLLNHKDLNMIVQHYGHLAERRKALRKAAEAAAKAGRTQPKKKKA